MKVIYLSNMENKIHALLIEAAQKINTAINYEKCIRVESDGTMKISHSIHYIEGSNFEFNTFIETFDHSMEVVIYLESLINPA